MNIENAKTLVSQLERLPDEKFNMGTWLAHPHEFARENISRDPKCGTVGCIAGWAAMLNGGVEDAWESISWAEEWLELYDEDADRLFYAYFARPIDAYGIRSRPLEEVTRTEAIAELRRMIAEAEAA